MKDSLAGAAAVQLRARRPGRPDAFAFVRAADPNGRRFHPSACRVVCSSRPCFTPSIPRRRSFAVLNPHCRCPRNPSDSPFHPPPLPLPPPFPIPSPLALDLGLGSTAALVLSPFTLLPTSVQLRAVSANIGRAASYPLPSDPRRRRRRRRGASPCRSARSNHRRQNTRGFLKLRRH